MDRHGVETNNRRNLLNGLVTAATRSWRHGLQQNGHTSNAMVFPTITTAINTSPTSRTPTVNSTTVPEEQRRRLQQQQHQDHRLNVLWYGGDDLHQQHQQIPTLLFESNNQYQSTDDWEKQPLRQQQRKSHKPQSQQNQKKKNRPALPGIPVVWAAMLHAMYALAMATLFYIYGATTGSGWIWFRGIVDSNSSIMWLWKIPATWYYMVQAFCASIVGCFLYRWCCLRQQQRNQLCYYILLILFSTALFPSVPIAEIFNNNNSKTTTIVKSLNNSTTRQQQQLDTFNLKNFGNNQLALYEGLWQVAFFVFVAYCLVLPKNICKKLDNTNEKYINNQQNNDIPNTQTKDNENQHITTAVLLFTIIASVGHTSLNAYIAYHWYFQQYHQHDNSITSMAAVQQLLANVVVLACINLIGWLLRQSVVRDRAEIKNSKNEFEHSHKRLSFKLRQQANKLNLLLTSLLPRRVFSEMKYDIVTDAARSLTLICSSSEDDYKNKPHLQRPQQELQLLTSRLPKMYIKEYDNVSIVCASITGFWDNVSAAACHGESGFLQSHKLILLVDKIMTDLYQRIAHRNHCIRIRLLGHRTLFVAGLPTEESYGFKDDEHKNARTIDDDGHARNAIRMGLDLINAINIVVHDVSRRRYGHKINLNIRVGVHSGRVTCGVLGFTGCTNIYSNFGSRWQYEIWGRDVLMASDIEANGRPGWVHVSQATVDQITRKKVSASAVTEIKHAHPGVIFRNNKNSNLNNNRDNYTFERVQNHNRINTYFVVPNTMCLNSEMSGNLTISDDNDHHYSDDIESLILQSVEQQLKKEETLRKNIFTNLSVDNKISETILSPTTSTTAAVTETPIIAPSTPVAPTTSIKMIMNRHRRSRYEQESLQSIIKNNTNITTGKERSCRWEEDVFGNNDNNQDKVKNKSNDEDLFRIAKSQLLLLCLIITLFVVNVTTMPWTILLGITFITPFVITAGELIYVMALLIGWISHPKLQSSTYIAAIIADDNEYYQHYDSDNNDSDSSSSSDSSDRCLNRLLVSNNSNNCAGLGWILKLFQWKKNTAMTTRNTLGDNENRRWFFPKWCCSIHHSWFTWCLGNDRTSSIISSDDSDIESRLGFRNEHAVMATTSGASLSQQLQNRSHYSHQNNNSNYSARRLHQKRTRLKRKYQDEERHTWFFWIAACNEVFVVLLICLLALLNAFTCEPVMVTTTNAVYDQLHIHSTINNNSGRFNTPIVNITRQQQFRSSLTCPWPQYAMITCCLACVSIAIAFPIYYGSFPTLRMKIGTLLVMTFVFAVAFVHFTHQHVFHAASISLLTSSSCGELNDIHNHQIFDSNITINSDQDVTKTIARRDLYQNQKLSKLQDQEQLQAAGLDTATTTVYVVTFATALLIFFVYAHRLKDRLAHHRVKTNCYVRRLSVLRKAHQRTLHSFLPDHVTNLLQVSCKGHNINVTDDSCNEIQQQQNFFNDTQSMPMTFTKNHVQRRILPHISRPLYHCGYRAVVIIFATIVQEDHILPSTINNGESHYHRQIAFLHDIFSEFDRVLDNQKFHGLIEKIKMIGTNTYMVAVGLQHQHGPERQLVMLLREMKRRNKGTCNNNEQDKKSDIESHTGSKDNDPLDGYELYDVISANYVIFALDFVQDMRRILHRKQTTELIPVGNVHISEPSQFTLRVGVNIGPIVAGLIGCNDSTWKQPKFDVWGNTVNVARKMDTTGIPGCTQVTNCVVDVMKSIKDPKYEFDVRTNVTNKNQKRITYFVREHSDKNKNHHIVQQQLLSNYHQLQFRQNAIVHKNYHLELDKPQQYKHPVVARSPQNMHRVIAQQLDREQSPTRPIVTVHPQNTYYNARVQHELRPKCLEPLKTPPPPPTRSPPAVSIPMFQHQCIKKQRTPDTTTKPEVTYARPLQQQKLQKQNNQSGPGLVSQSMGLSPSDGLQQSSTTITDAKSACSPYAHITAEGKQQRLCRPTVLPLVNTSAGLSGKNFDADRPLPAPPRSSDTVAGRQRHHHDPRRRRRLHHDHQPAPQAHSTTIKQQQEEKQVQGSAKVAWPSSVRSPVSVGSFVSMSSRQSSPSSSGSTDAGNTTTSNNNYNTTTTTSSSSSSDESFGLSGGVHRAVQDVEDFDTAASSAVVSPIHRRYRQQLLRQWSPSMTANSSPVRRSSSFRSPMSGSGGGGDITGPSSSSLRSPLGQSAGSGVGCTQSLNRRRIHTTNTGGGGGGSSGRRRKRRQQQQQQQNQQNAMTATKTEQTTLSPCIIPDISVVTDAIETYESPPSSPWKKQQYQRRQGSSGKDQGTSLVTSPDFTDEIRRILLLDNHRGNVRQHESFDEQNKEVSMKQHDNDSIERVTEENDVKQQSFTEQHRDVRIASTSGKLDKNDGNNVQNKNNNSDNVDLTSTEVPITVLEPDISASLFKERERQITEQVKRQEAEVRRILQAHKNNVVSVVRGVAGVTGETGLQSRRQRVSAITTAESSEWSDDESVEPSSLLDEARQESTAKCKGDYKANIDTVTTEYTFDGEGDGYTTGGDGDGYTTTGYTTDEAAANPEIARRMNFGRTVGLPITSARHLDDNLSTMNDTGLTDAEAALSDVNSMIDFNDGNDSNRFGSRRQSSLSSSSVCPYASDSLCDDDYDYNDEGEFNFHDDYDLEDEKLDSCDDDDFNSRRYNLHRLLHQQKLFLSQSSTSPPPSDACSNNNNKNVCSPQQQQLQQLIPPLSSSYNSTLDITLKTISDSSATALITTMVTTAATINDDNSNKSIATTSSITTTTASTNTEPVEQP